jgi:hypothetical protein
MSKFDYYGIECLKLKLKSAANSGLAAPNLKNFYLKLIYYVSHH